MINLDLLDNVFRDAFPARAASLRASLEYYKVEPRGDGTLDVVVRLVVWDVNAETGYQSIRDVKEQAIRLPVMGLDIATLARLGELTRALVVVASKALETPDLERMMPSDFVDFSPLKLVKATTEADFVAALSAPSRLGRYLTNPA